MTNPCAAYLFLVGFPNLKPKSGLSSGYRACQNPAVGCSRLFRVALSLKVRIVCTQMSVQINNNFLKVRVLSLQYFSINKFFKMP